MTITYEDIKDKIISNDEMMGQVLIEIKKEDLGLFQDYIAQSDTCELVDTTENGDNITLWIY